MARERGRESERFDVDVDVHFFFAVGGGGVWALLEARGLLSEVCANRVP